MFAREKLKGTRRWLPLLVAAAISVAAPPARATEEAAPESGAAPAPPSEPPSIRQLVGNADVVRGSPVTVLGKNLPPDGAAITLWLGPQKLGPPNFVAKDGTSLSFVVPGGSPESKGDFATLGWALLRIEIKAPAAYPAMTTLSFDAGYLHVVSDVKTALTLTKADPPVVSPDSPHIWLFGEGMGGTGADYALRRDGRELKLCWEEKTPCIGNHARFISAHQLEIDGPFDGWEGLHDLGLRRGDVAFDAPNTVRFIAYTSTNIRLIALAASFGIIGLVLAAALSNRRTISAPGDSRSAATLLLDPETDTYSLAKFQLVAWSVAGVLGYLYLTLSRAIAQGYVDIADVPDNLPTMLGVSAGTAAISMGIAAAKGPKAAGDVHPGLADLVGTGGVIAADRFQLLLWTLVAIATFLFTVFRVDPAMLGALPKIPANLLQLSTVSSGAYLAGKLMRNAGPVVDTVIATVGSLNLMIQGRSLHSEASIEIDGISITPFLDAEKHPDLRPTAVKPNQSTGFSSTLKVSLVACAPEWVDKEVLSVTVINPDGQLATWPLQLDDALKQQLSILPASLTSARPLRG